MTTQRAVAYYRHSAEDKQENSVAIQQSLTKKFAEQNSIEIIHEEQDQGKSGLTANRSGFGRLFSDWIQNPKAQDFQFVLVYDISRWGRFQDQDEAGFYEFLCRKHGKTVVYVNRGFPSPGNELLFSLQKSIERYMAAEYSKQLSGKVFHGSVLVSRQGFSAGGPAAYGMRRSLVDESRNFIQNLERGEHKIIANQRVRFEPGIAEEQQVVRQIFNWFVIDGLSPGAIAARLNSDRLPSPMGRIWKPQTIRRILRNPTYAGAHTYNKTSQKLKAPRRANSLSEWVVTPDAHHPIVGAELFAKAQAKFYRERKPKCKKLPMALDLPVIKASPLFENDKRLTWCFSLRRNHMRFNQIVCVGLSSDLSDRRLMLVPRRCFSNNGSLIVTDCTEEYQRFTTSYYQSLTKYA